MAKIEFDGNLVAFGEESVGSERTLFGDVAQSDDLADNLNTEFKRGWGVLAPGGKPPKQWFTGALFTATKTSAWIRQYGITPYSTTQEYNQHSITNYNGVLYRSLVDNNIGNAVTSIAFWEPIVDIESGDYTVDGNWTFNNPVDVAPPTLGTHATTKDYVDTALAGVGGIDYNNFINLGAPANGYVFTPPENGLLVLAKKSNGANQYLEIRLDNGTILGKEFSHNMGAFPLVATAIAQKDVPLIISFSTGGDWQWAYFYYAQGV